MQIWRHTVINTFKIKADSGGNLKSYVTATNTWLSVPDNLQNNNKQNITELISTTTSSIIGAVGALATLGSNYQSLQLSLSVK